MWVTFIWLFFGDAQSAIHNFKSVIKINSAWAWVFRGQNYTSLSTRLNQGSTQRVAKTVMADQDDVPGRSLPVSRHSHNLPNN